MTAVTVPVSAPEVGRSAATRIAAAIVLVARATARSLDSRLGRGQLGVPREIEVGRITGGRI